MRNDLGTQYLSAMYWAFTTLTTVGYGDIVPVNNDERIFTVVMEFVGLTVFGMVIGTITQIAADFNVQKKLMNERTQEVDQYMRERGLSKGLQRRIRSFYEYYLERKSVFNVSEVLSEVSSTLKHELCGVMFAELVKDLPFFQKRDASFVALVGVQLEPFFVLTGEYVCRKGVIGMEMYWLRKGRVVLIDPALVGQRCALGASSRSAAARPQPRWRTLGAESCSSARHCPACSVSLPAAPPLAPRRLAEARAVASSGRWHPVASWRRA